MPGGCETALNQACRRKRDSYERFGFFWPSIPVSFQAGGPIWIEKCVTAPGESWAEEH